VARELRRAGWPRARALVGGWAAWQQAGLSVEPKAKHTAEGGATA
jgi:3-mercaptopyruvate sulfurtransferase SseA